MSAPAPVARSTFALVASRGVAVHALLAAAALVAAYRTWSHAEEPERPQQSVVVLECTPAELRSISLVSERRTVRIDWRREGAVRSAWVTVRDVAAADAPQQPPKRFVASEVLDRWLDENLPLRATRSLGEVDRARLAELELVDTTGRLEFDCGARHGSYRLGGSAYGTGDRYARATSGGPVYLLGAAVAGDLEAAEARFMQRELHRFLVVDVDELRVVAAGRTRTFLQRNRRTPHQAEWVDQTAPARRNELYGNWIDRVAALRITAFLPEGREPGSEVVGGGRQITPVVTLRYRADGDEKGTLDLVRVDGPAGAPSYYARSEVTHGWAKVLDSIAAQIEQDVRPVVGLEPLTPPPAPSAPPAVPTSATSSTHP